jgi:hypothetical protein
MTACLRNASADKHDRRERVKSLKFADAVQKDHLALAVSNIGGSASACPAKSCRFDQPGNFSEALRMTRRDYQSGHASVQSGHPL